MVAVITAVLAGSEVGLAVVVAFDAPVAALAAGCVGALVSLVVLMRYQHHTWQRAEATSTIEDAGSVF